MLCALVVAGGLWAWYGKVEPAERYPVGLMSSLPIYWPEGFEIQVIADSDRQVPWVRRVLEEHYTLAPLDALEEDADRNEPGALAGIGRLLIAQPRGLSPADNVALDEWVRKGGRLLFVLDPMLTGQYAVPIGDPRHPVAVGLIPPVLIRWGLDMRYNENQPLELRDAKYGAGSIPVLLSGEMALAESDAIMSAEDRAARGDCRILGDAVVAQCTVGQGRVTVVADAALFELSRPKGDAETQMLALTKLAFE